MPKPIQTFHFPGTVLWKWEMGADFITLYDDVSYNKRGYPRSLCCLMQFLSVEKKLFICKNGKAHIYSSDLENKKLLPVRSQDESDPLNSEVYIVLDHYLDDRSYYHPFSFVNDFFNSPREYHYHLKFKHELEIRDKQIVLQWMSDYLDQSLEETLAVYGKILEPLPVENNQTPMRPGTFFERGRILDQGDSTPYFIPPRFLAGTL